MLRSEDDELLYLAGQTNTKEPADKHSLHEGYVYYLQMSFKNSVVTCIFSTKKEEKKLYQKIFLIVRNIKGEKRRM